MKQQLANKIEIAQSSYNVVLNTLNQMSKIYNQPRVDQNIQNNLPVVSEDDWDEGSKVKFLNTG